MRKLTWILAIIVLMGGVIIGCKTKFPTTTNNYKAVSTSHALARGKVLAFSICAGCHYDRAINKFIGTQIHDIPGIAGKVYSANLTHSGSHGIMAKYTDAEVKYLLKTGVANDGRFLNYMLRPNMADQDIDAIIAFIRSDDASVAAADTAVGLTHLTFVGKAFMNIKAKPMPYQANVKLPAISDKVKLGYYLIDNLGCFHCHSKSLTKLNFLYPDQTKGYLAGGIKLKGKDEMDIYASNITPDKNTGIGDYTKEQFFNALQNGRAPDRVLRAPMPKFDKLTHAEIDAMYAYLQTVPPQYKVVKKI
ncbi:cytochrome c family protein [Mucilaginibacter gilvus]|uniref:Cytochrome c n=1 Tax=Mucilaginibacter gilvus TaxID=2305909 RepID=A0A3S3ULU6_9SPHI|nr:cytochrome c [Mucilaginibacter gilvus]RWY49433.1 cytochrome c [Mucilaginibacter gilvus]